MKRLVWLLLAAFCTAFAQVQPVAVVTPEVACDCCRDQPSACGMPDCGAMPARGSTQTLAPTATVREAGVMAVRRAIATRFVSSAFNRDSIFGLAGRAPLTVARAARAPLFKAHCSFLI